MAGAVVKTVGVIARDGKGSVKIVRKGISAEEAAEGISTNDDIPFGKMLRCRIRYFTDGAVIGSRSFVDEAFAAAQERFGSNRKTGARKPKGDAAVDSGSIWSLRDLKKGI